MYMSYWTLLGTRASRPGPGYTTRAVMGARPWLASVLLATALGAVVTAHDDHRHLIRDPRQVDLVESLDSYSVIFPRRVDGEGQFISHTLEHVLPPATRRRKRDIHEDTTLYYHIDIDGEPVHLKLTPNDALFAPGLVVERRRHRAGNVSDSTVHRIHGNTCHFRGHVIDDEESKVSLATCKGLTGALHLSKGDFLVEPVRGHDHPTGAGHPHIVYRRPVDDKHDVTDDNEAGTCGVEDEDSNEKARERWEEEHNPRSRDRKSHHRRQKRSISLERNVETLIVVDHTMVQFYRDDDIENYVLTIMNMVSTIYHDATLGNAVNIALVRLIFMEKKEPILDITHHAENTLNSFCKWQQSINPDDDSHPNHHDVAVLLTRLDICAQMNEPCSTLGLAHVTGMCQPHRSCSVNEDTGLALSFTVAHELGHNFGMQHDGEGNKCKIKSEAGNHVMSPQISGDSSSLAWSNCSRNYITRFLDREWGYCLNDSPQKQNFTFPTLPPGVMYDANHQCRLQYGIGATFCEGVGDVCTTLWCQVNNKCLTRMDVTAHGTNCGVNKWCYSGQCVPIGESPQAIHGEWGAWTDWGRCSRSCGGGVSVSQRHCNNPPPSHGGQYCLGERKRYRICNTEDCLEGAPSFRAQQCAQFNDIPYENRLYRWVPESTENPCQLNCRPENEFFSVLLEDAVADGTPCSLGRKDMCIAGQCKHVGCDWILASSATEDQCGVCKGDGTTCKTIKNQFNKTIGKGYEEAVVIPEGARNIRIEEVAEANNYLAVRDSEGESLLNGNWYIQWSGDYEAAGTIIHYERDGNKERVESPGPIKEPLHIMLLFQSQNPGVVFEYTVPTEDSVGIRKPEFAWELEGWTHCSASCGGGQQLSRAVCKEREAGLVDSRYCNASVKPEDQRRSCNNHACPARWWFGPWQHCSMTCGPYGRRRRTVLCVRSLGLGEQLALDDDDCGDLPRPDDSKLCSHRPPCPETSEWITGPWDQECEEDPCEVQRRQVKCSGNSCDPADKPREQQQCGNVTCGTWLSGNWTLCTRSCGGGIRLRSVRCRHGDACLESVRPEFQEECAPDPCPRQGAESAQQDKDNTENNNSIFNLYKHRSSQQTGLSSANHHYREEPNSPSSEDNSTESEQTTLSPPMTSSDVEEIQATTEIAAEKYRWIPLFWEQCSRECGGGERRRKVMCIEVVSLKEVSESLCGSKKKPDSVQTCNVGTCASWWSGPWSECSVSCGSGEQARHVQCVDPSTRQPAIACAAKDQPISTRTCQELPCTKNAAFQQQEEYQCEADIINSQLCKSLKKLGQCQNSYIQLKCCRTCHERRKYDISDTTS